MDIRKIESHNAKTGPKQLNKIILMSVLGQGLSW